MALTFPWYESVVFDPQNRRLGNGNMAFPYDLNPDYGWTLDWGARGLFGPWTFHGGGGFRERGGDQCGGHYAGGCAAYELAGGERAGAVSGLQHGRV
jgi:hypothetical protein